MKKLICIGMATMFETMNPDYYEEGDVDLPYAMEFEGELTEASIRNWLVARGTSVEYAVFRNMGDNVILVDIASSWFIFREISN